MANYCTESYDFGPDVGVMSLQQYSGWYFHQQCLSINSQDTDNTGTRMHQGAHVLIRLLAKKAHLLCDRSSWIEIGAGSGIVTLAALSAMNYCTSKRPRVVITDGNEKCLSLIAANYNSLYTSKALSLQESMDIKIMKLHWGNKHDANHSLAFNDHKPFDIIVGSELIYYRADPVKLVETVTNLAGPNTIFIHAHIVRVAGMGTELARLLERVGFNTYEYNIGDIVGDDELTKNPGFHEVRTLISVPRSQEENILKATLGIELMNTGEECTIDSTTSYRCALRRFIEDYTSNDGVTTAEDEVEKAENIFDILMQHDE